MLDGEPVHRFVRARLFRRPWMEACSWVHPAVPAVLFVPVAVGFGGRAWGGMNGARWAGALGAGIFAWTIVEYALHRFVFHVRARSRLGRALYFYSHGVHHQYPDDAGRLVMVPIVSIPLAVLFWAVARTVAAGAAGDAAFAGLVVGYLGYDYTHLAVHVAPPPRARWLRPIAAWLRAARRRHMRHHFDDPARGFGVSTALWDRVFGTAYPPSSPVSRS